MCESDGVDDEEWDEINSQTFDKYMLIIMMMNVYEDEMLKLVTSLLLLLYILSPHHMYDVNVIEWKSFWELLSRQIASAISNIIYTVKNRRNTAWRQKWTCDPVT
jgi:hypothetical protein